MITLKLDGRSLRLEDIENVAFGADIGVQLDEDAKVRMRESRALIEDLVLSGDPVYGVTTGFGRLADVTIAPENREALQHNLVRTNAASRQRAVTRALRVPR